MQSIVLIKHDTTTQVFHRSEDDIQTLLGEIPQDGGFVFEDLTDSEYTLTTLIMIGAIMTAAGSALTIQSVIGLKELLDSGIADTP